jgi:hypothetical protein
VGRQRGLNSINNNRFHEVNHVVLRVEGVGLTTGLDYHWNGDFSLESNADITPPFFPHEETFVVTNKIIGNGPVPNEKMSQTFHITINADGTVTVLRSDFDISCQG